MIEVRWTKRWDSLGGGPTKVISEFVLHKKGDDLVSLVQVDVSRTVWNGKSGIAIDHKNKQATVLTKKPAFQEADFLQVPGVSNKKLSVGQNVEVSSRQLGGKTTDVVRISHGGFDTGGSMTHYFSQATHLVVGETESWFGAIEDGSHNITRNIKLFDVYALLDDEPFSLDVPKGYRIVNSAT